MASAAVVEDVRLVEIAGHTYRQRTQLPGTRDCGRPTAAAPQQQQADWSAEDIEELEILTMEDAQDAELAHISPESDSSFVSQIDLDPQVGGQEVPQVTASAISKRLTHCCVHALQLLPFIIGKGGNTKKQIEQETGATLIIPKGKYEGSLVQGPGVMTGSDSTLLCCVPAQTWVCWAFCAAHTRPSRSCLDPADTRRDQPHHQQRHPSKQQQQQQQVLGSKQSEALIIKGSSKQAVASARVRTQLLIDSVISSRMLDYTHFVSIPLANPQTAAKLQDFQAKVGLPRWRCCRLALPCGRFFCICALFACLDVRTKHTRAHSSTCFASLSVTDLQKVLSCAVHA